MPAGYTSGNSSVLDTIVRTYRNGADDIIATQEISVVVRRIDGVNGAGMALVNTASTDGENSDEIIPRFRRTGSIKLRTQLSPKSGASAVIANVTTTGRYNSRSESGGDVVSVTYTGAAGENDLIIPVTALSGVLEVGDTV